MQCVTTYSVYVYTHVHIHKPRSNQDTIIHAVVMESLRRIASPVSPKQSGPTRDLLESSMVPVPPVYMSMSFVMVMLKVTYIAGHTDHELGVCELHHLSLPASIKRCSGKEALEYLQTHIRQDVGNRTKRNDNIIIDI